MINYININTNVISHVLKTFFRYEMVRVTENTMEPSVHGKGFVNYLLDGVEMTFFDE